MPTSSVAQILLRLVALNWILTGLIQLFGPVYMAYINETEIKPILFAPSVSLMVFGILCWIISAPLSRLLSRRNEGEFSLQGASQETLYATGLLCLGVYFSLNSFANAFSWIHYFAMNKLAFHDGFSMRRGVPSSYTLFEAVATFLAGVTLSLNASRWARRLVRRNIGPAPAATSISPEGDNGSH